MRNILSILALAMGLTVSATTADARWSEGQDLRFVVDTKISNTGGPIALCHLVEFTDVLFIPVYTIVESYALSNDGCTGENYRAVTAEDFAELQKAGMVPANLPASPKARLDKLAWGHAWLILCGFALLKTGYKALRGGKRRKKGAPDALVMNSLVAMSQVAVADGRIDDAEVRQIANILTRLSGKNYHATQISQMLSQLNPATNDIAHVGQDLSERDRQIVLEAALTIAVADGEIHQSEYLVVSDLAQRMNIGAADFRTTLARISAHLQTIQHP